MLAINIEDVISVLNTCKPYLIGLAVVLVLAIVAMIACRKMARSKKFLIRRRGRPGHGAGHRRHREPHLLWPHEQPYLPGYGRRLRHRRDCRFRQ